MWGFTQQEKDVIGLLMGWYVFVITVVGASITWITNRKCRRAPPGPDELGPFASGAALGGFFLLSGIFMGLNSDVAFLAISRPFLCSLPHQVQFWWGTGHIQARMHWKYDVLTWDKAFAIDTPEMAAHYADAPSYCQAADPAFREKQLQSLQAEIRADPDLGFFARECNQQSVANLKHLLFTEPEEAYKWYWARALNVIEERHKGRQMVDAAMFASSARRGLMLNLERSMKEDQTLMDQAEEDIARGQAIMAIVDSKPIRWQVALSHEEEPNETQAEGIKKMDLRAQI